MLSWVPGREGPALSLGEWWNDASAREWPDCLVQRLHGEVLSRRSIGRTLAVASVPFLFGLPIFKTLYYLICT